MAHGVSRAGSEVLFSMRARLRRVLPCCTLVERKVREMDSASSRPCPFLLSVRPGSAGPLAFEGVGVVLADMAELVDSAGDEPHATNAHEAVRRSTGSSNLAGDIPMRRIVTDRGSLRG
jgi:hypothetical protein